MQWQIKSFDDLTNHELYALLRLRSQVFVVEQNAAYLDADGHDLAASHLLLKDGQGALIACCRLLPPGVLYPEPVIGRVVVDPAWRGRGLAHEMLRQAIPLCLASFGGDVIRISAQKHLAPFYAQHGFRQITDDYLEDGIPHVGMLLDRSALRKSGDAPLDIRYLGHSAWLVITPARCLLFDYGDRPVRHSEGSLANGIFNLDELPDLPLYAFASHRHADHYSARLHSMLARRAKTSFILGLDEQPSCAESEAAPNGTWLAWPHAELVIDDMTVRCSGSTDSGVSFLVEAPEICLYHGGDLALWDNTAFYHRVYREEVDWLSDRLTLTSHSLDLAFLPVSTSDGYQEEALLQGLWYLLGKMAPNAVLPMHGHGYEELYRTFAELAAGQGYQNVRIPLRRGDQLQLTAHRE